MSDGWPFPVSPVLSARFQPVERLSAGAGGQVLLCEEAAAGRTVVLKHSGAQQRGDAVLNARFLREARLLGRIEHPYVARLLDAGEDLGARWLLLEHLEGPTLEALVQARGALPVGPAVAVGSMILEALAGVHAAGILHRDVKPANVVVVPQRGAVLIDFGICRSLLDSQSLTDSGLMVGTPAFIAPEIVAGAEPSPACDLYSAALVVHYLLTGREAFARPKVFDALRAQIEEPAPPLERVPAALAELVAAWLAKDPAARPAADASARAAALVSFR